MLSRGAVRQICGGWSVSSRYGYGYSARLCTDVTKDATADEIEMSKKDLEIAKEEYDTGRTLAKLSLMVTAAKGAIKTAARERMLYPETQVRMEEEIKESQELISNTLKSMGSNIAVDELGDKIDSDKALRIPAEHLTYKQLMRAEYLRDSFEDTMVSLNVLPPKKAWVDGSDKLWCRLDRREAKRKAAEEAARVAAGEGADGTISSMERDLFTQQESTLPPTIERVSESELLKRKTEMESLSKMTTVLHGFDTALLEVKRVHKVHKGGTALSMRALVVIGDRKGTAGYGEGKSETTAHAVERACRDAKRNLLTLTRKDDRTIYHRVEGKYVKSRY